MREEWCAGPFSIALDIRAPLRTGDTIAVAVEVAEVSPASDGVRAKVATINSGIDQDNDIVMEYRARPAPRVRPRRKSTSRR